MKDVKKSLLAPFMFFLGLVFIFFLLLCPPVSAFSQYSFLNLDAVYSEFGGINDIGQIALSKGSQGFLWDNGTKIQIGSLGGGRTHTSGINNLTQIVGNSDLTDPYSNRAFLWENGNMKNLGTLGGDLSSAHAVNDSGQVVGRSSIHPLNNDVYHAFLWEKDVMRDLGTLSGPLGRGDRSGAVDINNSGSVVGWSNDASNTWIHSFLWKNDSMTDLGTLGGNYSYANAINDYDQVVGNSADAAFLWENGNMKKLPSLFSYSSYAEGINNQGQIVGTARVDLNSTWPDTHAVLWENGEVIDLNRLLLGNPEWVLSNAYDINEQGQILCHGFLPGSSDRYSFLLNPAPAPIPEPSTIFLLGSGLIGLLGFKRKFRSRLL